VKSKTVVLGAVEAESSNSMKNYRNMWHMVIRCQQ